MGKLFFKNTNYEIHQMQVAIRNADGTLGEPTEIQQPTSVKLRVPQSENPAFYRFDMKPIELTLVSGWTFNGSLTIYQFRLMGGGTVQVYGQIVPDEPELLSFFSWFNSPQMSAAVWREALAQGAQIEDFVRELNWKMEQHRAESS